jgi:hypothetical protein
MIDIRKLKELVRLMVDNDLTELDLRDSEEQVTVRRIVIGQEKTSALRHGQSFRERSRTVYSLIHSSKQSGLSVSWTDGSSASWSWRPA